MTSPRSRPTLDEVAQLAGASRATVSRVVNGSERVRPATRDAVLAAVRELGYVPNFAARSLMINRTDTFGFVVPEAQTRVFSDDAFFATVMQGAGEELDRADKQLLLMLAPTSTSYERIERYATGGHVDGVIIASMHGPDPLLRALLAANVPVVASGRPLATEGVPYVDVDHRRAVREAVEHLYRAGRANVVTIAGPQEMVAGVERLEGYLKGVAAAGAAPVVAYGDFTRDSGFAAMTEILASGVAVDAVFAASDLMADGAMRALRAHGRRIPDDVAVIGFDDSAVARYCEPPLTTIRQPLYEIGTTLARQILALANGDEIDPAVVLNTELVVRESG